MTGLILRELRAARDDRNLSGAAVASALGVSAAQYSRLERGLTSGLSIEQAVIALVQQSGWTCPSASTRVDRRSGMQHTRPSSLACEVAVTTGSVS